MAQFIRVLGIRQGKEELKIRAITKRVNVEGQRLAHVHGEEDEKGNKIDKLTIWLQTHTPKEATKVDDALASAKGISKMFFLHLRKMRMLMSTLKMIMQLKKTILKKLLKKEIMNQG